ncbi:uncharacterized protein AKAW2_21131A [Aspergillus luchuensis]|uniref:Similar to An02g05930 n=1 Tax=Aspergillus kawachii TaxID=1069201 RepID=A0A146FM80_ASPKA|nr:uncharacterized protein AKAW2_21131A [Aspergillus luchuensis]BCR96191.1 hypothetical protein AKAW2_21131A [Aspergillus luchuensis]BCS08707.1 hypothetical protein ALUC_21077A [Aspergillus luchuensis]GAA82149.1 similar to An02g05930 [Aspergillus luchuensis IFO 4308]GAT26757.1 similar to An02g05930 [Aspergillus luchuensis]
MSRLLLFAFRKLLNTFIRTAGNDPLLANTHGLFQESPTEPPQNVLELTLAILGLSLEFIIRYIIGNRVMSLLILDTIDSNPPNPNKDRDKDDNKKSNPKPTTTRNLLQTLTTLHREEGLVSLINGFHYTIYYNLRYFIVTGLLTSPIARFPEPLAHIIASVALAEFHFFRTAGAILPPAEQMRYVPLSLDYYRWKALLLPTLLYASAETIMMYVPELLLAPVRFDRVLLQPEDLTDVTSLVRSDVLVAGLMLVAQVLVLLPACIVLIVVEGSLVTGDCETLIPLPGEGEKMGDGDNQVVLWKEEDENDNEDEEYPKQKGRLIKDLFRFKGPLHVLNVLEMISVRQLLYCFELHGKMCLCVVGVATAVQSVMYLVS